jgi:hypothetical protein
MRLHTNFEVGRDAECSGTINYKSSRDKRTLQLLHIKSDFKQATAACMFLEKNKFTATNETE